MFRIEILTDIPDSDLKELVDDFERDSAKVSTKKQADGSWVVVAVFDKNNNDYDNNETS